MQRGSIFPEGVGRGMNGSGTGVVDEGFNRIGVSDSRGWR